MRQKFKVALVFGTRPEIIKLSPVIRCFEETKTPYFMIHSGQHYSPEMDGIFFKELKLPKPRYTLVVRSRAPYRQGDHTARMLSRIEEIFLKENPSHVIVQGDTNTVLAGSLAAAKITTTKRYTGLGYTLCHVEAGLRSFDREMPEEINRFISDHLSDMLFVPTSLSKRYLLKEGVKPRNIFITGNTVVDAVFQNREIAQEQIRLKDLTREERGKYILVTLHRQENVDEPKRFKEILKGIGETAKALQLPVLFPMHPRTRVKIKKFRFELSPAIHEMKPVGYLQFLMLQANAALILSDSGGIQEEACILKVPCVTLRTTTERPETVTVGANALAGVRSRNIVQAAKRMIRKPKKWRNPYGNGKTSYKILKLIKNYKPLF